MRAVNWLEKHVIEKPDHKFINDLTFREVNARIADLAQRLHFYVKQEKRVALCANNSVDTALFFLALQILEKEVLMLNTRLTVEEKTKQLKALHIRTVFSDDDQFVPFRKIYQQERSKIKFTAGLNEKKMAVIMNTSATTGECKSVLLRWKQLDAHVRASQQRLGVTAADNWLIVLPMYHISGLSILLRSLYNGTQVTIMNRYDENAVISLIESKRINMVSIVPTMLNRIVSRLKKHHLRVVLAGGEFIPKPLVEQSMIKNIPIYKTFGMTEATSQLTTFSVLTYPSKINSVGLPLDGIKISIQHPDGQGAGEVWVKGPVLMDGYIGREKIDGYFNTEDIGYIDEDGFLYLLDRRKNIIISGGENIYPKEIENMLYQLSGIRECAVVGKKDKKWGSVPVLYVVSALPEELISSYLSQRLAKYKLPKEIIYLDELPRHGSGKISRKDLSDGACYAN